MAVGRSYYVRGWTSGSDRALKPVMFDPGQHCGACEGHGFTFDDKVNARRHHFMRYRQCDACRGTGRKEDAQASG